MICFIYDKLIIPEYIYILAPELWCIEQYVNFVPPRSLNTERRGIKAVVPHIDKETARRPNSPATPLTPSVSEYSPSYSPVSLPSSNIDRSSNCFDKCGCMNMNLLNSM